jgi:hypothetical protein
MEGDLSDLSLTSIAVTGPSGGITAGQEGSGVSVQTETPAKYHNSFTYDANGNILTQLRADQSKTNLRNAAYEQSPDFANNPHDYVDPNSYIDNIAYAYERNAEGEIVANRLYHVNDALNHPNDGHIDEKAKGGRFRLGKIGPFDSEVYGLEPNGSKLCGHKLQ